MRNGAHPWRYLSRFPQVTVVWVEMDGPLGATDGVSTIYLDPRQSQVQQRCTLAHELVHLHWGHDLQVPDPVEARVAHAAARWLLPDIAPVIEVLAWTAGRVEEAADELWVDPPTLTARLDRARLQPDEVAALSCLMDAA